MSFPHKTFPIDNSAILYLAQLRNNHSNTYRFTIALSEPVCPQTLQQAADRVCPRFPTIIAGFRPDFFSYTVVPAEKAPTVQKDPGLLRTMRMEEIRRCAYRIFYSGSEIHIEAFHALTDGYGAILSFRTLVAEYLRIRYGLQSPEQTEMLEGANPTGRKSCTTLILPTGTTVPARCPDVFRTSCGEKIGIGRSKRSPGSLTSKRCWRRPVGKGYR